MTLEGHADLRGTVPYNQALSERRVARVKSFLVEQGVPEANLETKAFGDQHNMTAAEVKSAVEHNPEITKEEKTRFLRNLTVIKWASNRRVDVTLNVAGQTETSVRRYPFNAADSLTLIGGREADRKAAAQPRRLQWQEEGACEEAVVIAKQVRQERPGKRRRFPGFCCPNMVKWARELRVSRVASPRVWVPTTAIL